MYRARAHVADQGCPIAGKLMLQVEVPVENVGTLGIGINKPVPDLLGIGTHAGVNAIAQGGVRIRADDLKRISRGGVEPEFIRER